MYLILATCSFITLFDHKRLKHRLFLKNQIKKEIKLSLSSMPIMAILMAPLFCLEVNGYSKLYSNINDYGVFYLVFSLIMYLLFTDCLIYWIHRAEHHPKLYFIHKQHHKWKVSTPFAAYAFNPLDGYLQALPYHLFPFLFPLHKIAYLSFFIFVMIWTVLIHDGKKLCNYSFINGAGHHNIHHLEFKYNFGQYFTLWDKIGNSHKAPKQK